MSDIVMWLGQISVSDDVDITVLRQHDREITFLVESVSAEAEGITGKLRLSQGEAVRLMVCLEASLKHWWVRGPMPLSPFATEGPLGRVPIVEEEGQ